MSDAGVPAPRRVAANPPLLVGFGALEFTLFSIPTITLFWKDQIGMSVTDIMVLQAVFGVAVVLLEFPSGYFADRAGYRTSLITGATLWAAGCVAYARGATFGDIVLAEIVLGAGSAFMSGADRALLWVSLDAMGRTPEYTRWEGRVRAAAQTTEAVSAAVGGWLYSIAPRLPFWMQVPAAGLLIATAFSVREVPRQRSGDRQTHLQRALRIVGVVVVHPRLRATMLLSMTLGLSTFVMVWLIQSWMQTRGIPPAWFGPFWAGAHVWLALVSLTSGRVTAALGARGTLLGCCLLLPFGYAGLALTESAWGAAFYLCFMTVRGLQGPILMTVMQANAPGDSRASVLSLAALLFRLSFVAAGPAIGALVDGIGLDTALGTLALIFPAVALGAFTAFSRAYRRAPTALA